MRRGGAVRIGKKACAGTGYVKTGVRLDMSYSRVSCSICGAYGMNRKTHYRHRLEHAEQAAA